MDYLNKRYNLSKKLGKKLIKTNKIVSVLKDFKKVYGIDVDDYRLIKKGYEFKKIKNNKLPFKNKFFDVVISNQVIEHVNDPEKHVQEINRVLKDKGVV